MNKYVKSRSLVELLIVFFVIIILFSLFFKTKIFDKRISHQNLVKLKKLQQVLYLARSEAIKLHNKVYLCPSYDKQTCCHNWTKNIMIFIIEQQKLKVLHYLEPLFNKQMLRFQFFGNSQHQQKITFWPTGLTVNNGHFCIDNNLYCLYINQSGRVYIINSTSNTSRG